MRYLFLLFLFSASILSCQLIAQNSDSYFRMIPAIDENTPAWAVEMYSDDPNVYEVEFMYNRYFDKHPFEKTIHTRNYQQWMMSIGSLINEDGYIRPPAGIPVGADFGGSVPRGGSSWTYLGPDETLNDISQGNFPVSWQANVYCMDQSISNPNILVAGIEGGDLFKTVDKGLNWFPIAQGVPISTVNEAKIAPSNPSIIYFAANGSDAVFRSVDGGGNWVNVYSSNNDIYQIAINSNNPDSVYAAGSEGLIRSFDGGDTWTSIFSEKCWDVQIHPLNNQIIYVLKQNAGLKKAEFYRSVDGGITWSLQSNGWYVPTDFDFASDGGGRIAVTPITPDKVYVGLLGASKSGDDGWIGMYVSSDAGVNWMNPSLPDGGPYSTGHHNLAMSHPYDGGYTQGFYDFGITASHTVANRVWIGCINFSVTSDAGASWTRLSGGGSGANDVGWLHPDIQDLHVLGQDVWVATDGGINYSNDEFSTHEARINGLSNSNMWGFGQGWNHDILVGGRYHNGNTGFVETYPIGKHLRLGGAEQSTGYVNPMRERKVYFSDISDKVLPSLIDEAVLNVGNLSLYPNESYVASTMSDLNFHPAYASHIILGKDNGIWSSKDEGNTFELLHEWSASDKVYEIEQVRSNPNILYCVLQPNGGYWDWCNIQKSTDGGYHWNELPTPPASNRWRLEITVNPENPDEIWGISTDRSSVFRSLNGGGSWEDMESAVLSGQKLKDIQFQAGTDIVYLASNSNVFFWNSTTGDWTDYSDGLPASFNTLEMRLFYRDSKLRLASGGKGIWERELVNPSMPIAQPIAWTDTIYCSRDTIELDCHSILDHADASWAWTLTPEPSYISSMNVRNPKIVLGAEGSYDVALTITDAVGNISTQSIPNMITMSSRCEADSVPGMALQTAVDGDYVQTPALGVTTNNFTITAWVKPNGVQPDYSGIVMNDGTTAGFNFREGNNTLGYHWPNGAWWWDSNLEVPVDEWSYVAMVASPTGMTLYVNGLSVTHSVSLDPAEIGTMKIGSYKAWGGRNYKGEIDEVCIWNRSLSRDEIRELRHITKEDLTDDPDLLVYYQFNEAQSIVLDKVGVKHAFLSGNASRNLSSAPVGGGSSYRFTADSGGVTEATGTGLSLEFPGTPPWPGEELVATRINLLPNVLPNENPNLKAYWIVNNYGNSLFNPLLGLKIDPAKGKASEAAIANPEKVQLFRRPSNDFEDTWELICAANQVTAGTNGFFSFDNSCNIGDFGQFFAASEDELSPINLLNFQISLSDRKNPILSWSNTSDILADHYDIGLSPDNFTWVNLRTTEGSQDDPGREYTWEDEEPLPGLSYYRITVTDVNGNISYSETRQIYIEEEDGEIRVLPTISSVKDGFIVENPEEEAIRFRLFNREGRLVMDLLMADFQNTVNTASLSSGVYVYQLKAETKIMTGKVILH